MENVYQNALKFFGHHPMWNSWAHALGGFGLAIILQYYLQGNPFVPVWIGWACMAISIIIHLRSMMK